MHSVEWLSYFEKNERRSSPNTPGMLQPLHPRLQRALVRALQCFQLGESGEGRVAREAALSTDPAADDAWKLSVAFYIREEGRHARELAQLLRAMGEPTIRKHSSEWLFERARRLMGLRAKMAVIAVAEVVGSTFYHTLATRIPCPHTAEVARIIAADEDHHLSFQRDYFARVLRHETLLVRVLTASALSVWFFSVLAGAIASVALGHGKLFRQLGMSSLGFAVRCVIRLYARPSVTADVRAGVAQPIYPPASR